MDYKEKVIALLNSQELSKEQKEKLEEIFPELAGSESEKIRKELCKAIWNYIPYDEAQEYIKWLEKQGQTFTKKDVDDAYLKGICDTKKELEKQGNKTNPYSGVSFEYNGHIWGMCARDNGVDIALDKQLFKHLEQQGDQKSFDYEHANIQQKDFAPKSAMEAIKKEKPKFDIGAWVVWQDKYYKVNYNGCGYELIDQNGLSTSLEYGTVDENAHLWDITKDAKAGDILASNKSIFIFQEEYVGEKPIAYCGLMNGLFIEGNNACWTNEKCYPATKEQRDTLFAKMKEEAGDTEKKELKTIEQNPDWSEEDERMKKVIVKILSKKAIRDSLLSERIEISQALEWIQKQGESYTKRDVDDAYVEGIAFAKNELEKQSKNTSKWHPNTEDNKPLIKHSVLMKTVDGVAEGEWQGNDLWYQYRWCSRLKDSDVLAWMELSDLKGISYDTVHR